MNRSDSRSRSLWDVVIKHPVSVELKIIVKNHLSGAYFAQILLVFSPKFGFDDATLARVDGSLRRAGRYGYPKHKSGFGDRLRPGKKAHSRSA
jgi:hypothetical protein